MASRASSLNDVLGRMLAGRYRLIRLLGTGGSAAVYVAEDGKLGRRVAVKILHADLAADAGFLRRFEKEARTSAGLRHPNVLAIHDWGEEPGVPGPTPYLVMELLDGGSLRDLLDRQRSCTLAQVTAIGVQAAKGLGHAHRRGLVHRDVKPGNLLFDGEGRLVVADFGLARALAEASVTEPIGTVLGTARYASPEQARGRRLDGRSDVYSLGLVLIEAATGSVPFSADTTMATLMARVDAQLVAPPELGPLGPIVEQATRPDPADRLDAAALLVELEAVASQLGPPEPLPLVRLDLDEPSPGGRARPVREPKLSGFVTPPGSVYDADADRVEESPDADATMFAVAPDGDVTAVAPLPAPATPDTVTARPARVRRHRGEPDERGRSTATAKPPWWKRWRLDAAIVAVIVLLVGGTGLAMVQPWRPVHPVPDLTGKDEAAALGVLRPLHVGLHVAGRTPSEEAAPGVILRQSPLSTHKLREGRDVSVTLSSGPAPRKVPALVGAAQADATKALADLALHVDPVVPQHDEVVPPGQVLGQDPPPGREVARGSAVKLVVSDGPAPRDVPSGLTGGSCADATAKLRAVGLGANCVSVFSDSVSVGVVVSTSPSAGNSAAFGSDVTVNVSKGPEMIAVPGSVVGKSAASAQQIISAAGLGNGPTYGPVSGTVFQTAPAIGTKVKRGTSVAIYTR